MKQAKDVVITAALLQSHYTRVIAAGETQRCRIATQTWKKVLL